MLVGLFISKPLATVTLCIYILPGLLCQDKPLNMAKLTVSIQCMLGGQNKNYPLHDCKLYDLQVGNKYNIRMISDVSQLINTKLWNRISSVLHTFKILLLHILKKTMCIYFFLTLFCTMTNKCMINWQIITLLLHVVTLLCHPQGARSSTLPSYTSMSNAVVGNTIYNYCT